MVYSNYSASGVVNFNVMSRSHTMYHNGNRQPANSEVTFKLDGVVAARFEEVSSSCTMQKKMGEESFSAS